jgi:transcriptional accessory protein Tex/SPT6
MELEGTWRNVVDFGAFVDIGVKQTVSSTKQDG